MSFSRIFKWFLIWQLAVVSVTLYTQFWLPERENFLHPDYYQSLPFYSRANFDGLHYLSIAQFGYGFAQRAFFPLYPALIKKLQPLFISDVATGILISSTSFILGLYLLTRLLSLDYNRKIVGWTVLVYLIFPASFFFSFVYTEGLFFLLVVASFYLARKHFWVLAALIGGLSTYTRFVGVFLFPALVIERLKSWPHSLSLSKKITTLLPLALILLGVGIYMLALQQQVGDPLAFIHVQKLFGQGRSDKIILLYQVFWRYTKMVATVNRADPLYLTILWELLIAVLFCVTSVISFSKHRLSYALFNLAAFLIPTLTGTFTSLPRYVLLCFPSFVIIAEKLAVAKPVVQAAYICVSAALFFIFLSLFVRGYWVA